MNYINRYLPALLVILPSLCYGQNIKGRVLDQQSNEPIPYVNIGILRGERGTVSDEQGYFFLDLTGENIDRTLRFSFIGYESNDISVSEIIQSCTTRCDIRLTPKVLKMQKVVVYPHEYVEKVVGNPKPLKHASPDLKMIV